MPTPEKYTDFEAHAGMPARDSVLYNWKTTQMSNGHAILVVKIEKESVSNEGGAMWRDRKARLKNCISQKNSVMSNDKREEQFAKFKAHVGMPVRGTKLFNWQMTQLSN